MENLILYNSPFPKKRIGRLRDGGYVIADLPGKYNLLIAGGVSDDISFEEAMIDNYPGLICFAFDGTVSRLPPTKKPINFVKKNLGNTNSESLTDLQEYFRMADDIFFKIDIEGHEFRVLPGIIESGSISKIKQLVVEIHTPLDIHNNKSYYSEDLQTLENKDMFDLISQLNKTHTLIHFHANNCCPMQKIDGRDLPHVFELTFIRNDFVEEKIWNTRSLPTVLDKPNGPERPDYIFEEYPYVDCKYTIGPYRKIPVHLYDEYTLGNKIPVIQWFIDDSRYISVKWPDSLVEDHINRFTPENIKNNLEGNSNYGNEACVNLLLSFEKYNLKNKKIAVIGSETPWIECLLINLGNTVTTIEYNIPECSHPKIECKEYFEFFKSTENTYDAVVSFSSVEHSGLGRYGDPLNPSGDIESMQDIYKSLKPEGLLMWGAPVGKDVLVWNVHRIYGPLRLPMLFQNFKEIDWFGTSKESLFELRVGPSSYYQPVAVLQKV